VSAVWMRARSELRTFRRSMVSLAVLVALGATVVMAAGAAARRTDSAYPRFVRAQRGADFFLLTPPAEEVPGVDPARISKLPQVAFAERVRWAFLIVRGNFVPGLVRSEDPINSPVDRFKIVAGRAADPARPGEVVLSLRGREAGLRLGESFRASFPTGAPPFNDFATALKKAPLQMQVVGVAAAPGGFPPQVSEISPLFYLTPAFFQRYPNGYDATPDSLLVRLKRGHADLRAFESGVERVVGTRNIPFDTLERGNQDANVQRSFHLQALALWLLAALASLAFLLILSQTLARQSFLEADEYPALSALGMSRAQLWGLGLIRAAIPAVAGALVALPVALALSTLAPIGLARTAEPSPGLLADWTVLGLGIAVTVLLVLTLAGIPAWRTASLASRARYAQDREAAARPSAMARLVARSGIGASGVAGVRLALERGRGRTAIPVRSSIASVSLGITVLAAAATFGAGLHHLLDVPRLYGVPWDMTVTSNDDQGAPLTNFSAVGARLLSLPEVRGVSVGRWGLTLTIKGQDIGTTAFDPVAGTPVVPAILEGRSPSVHVPGDRTLEAVLGTRVMNRLGLRIGQVVPGRLLELDLPVRVKVVGRGVLPSFNESTRIGDGAWVSYRAGIELAGRDPTSGEGAPNSAFLDLRPGVAHGPFLHRMADYLGTKVDDDLFEPPVATASDVVSFGRIRNMPELLAGVLVLFAATTLVHTLISAVRRKRRDLAILKTLGFVRGQVRRSVGIQASTLTAIALAIGLPIGVAVGRWLWASLANELGVVSSPVVPVTSVLVAIPVALLAANLIAWLPARSAARTQAALVLRSE
jgi:putative ABC transport system permease protein